jgi:serine/threonine protein kinase
VFEIGQWIDSQYLVLEKQRGRRWIVYKALDRMSENVFVIKTPASAFPEFSAYRFKEKAKTWIRLGQSEKLVTAFLLKDFDAVPHLFIECVDGPTLTDIICSRHGKPLPIQRIIDTVKQIAEGMNNLHKSSLTSSTSLAHGDLCPDNVLSSSVGMKITDIGLASAFSIPGGMQNADLLLRHLPCTAPEQIENPTGSSMLADIYSFGLLSYELATGIPPTAFKCPDDPLTGHVAAEPAPPRMRNSDCPRWLEEAILKCMAREPENRFQSFELIENFLAQMERDVKPVEKPLKQKEKSKRTSRVARMRGVAKKESGRLNHYYLGVEHIMLGILAEEESMVLSTLGDEVSAWRLKSKILSSMPKGEGPWQWEGIIKTPRYSRVLKMARKIRREYGDERMLPQHILLAILSEGQSLPVRVLKDLGIDAGAAAEKLRRELARRRPAMLVADDDAASTPFAHRMSSVASGPYFAPFTGRASELERAKELLIGENSGVIIVGESGVGKTTFAQQLGCAISDAAADSTAAYGGVFKLRTTALLALDEDGDGIIEHLKDTLSALGESKSIVFIEDLPMLLGIETKIPPKAVASVIKDAIASQRMLVIATATPADYAEGEKHNTSLFRYLDVVNLSEIPADETRAILHGAKQSCENEYSVKISGAAVEATLELSAESKKVRAIPAGILELLDRACAIARMDAIELDNRSRPIMVETEHVERALKETFSVECAYLEGSPEDYL